jgi:HSP20 family protein
LSREEVHMAREDWNPWNEFERLRADMTRLFGLGDLTVAEPEPDFPRLNVRRTPDHVVIEAVAPGLDRDALEITAVGDAVTIRGQRRRDPEVPADRYLRREREGGRFARSVRIGTRLAPDQARAAYSDGILRVEVPYAPEAKPHRVPIAS